MHESAEKSECIILGRWFLRKSDLFWVPDHITECARKWDFHPPSVCFGH
jgi:hypothetical protein